MNGFLQILIFLVVFLIVIAVICYCVRIVPQAKAYVVERLGAYHSTWHTGPHFMVPFIDRVANKVSLKEIVKDFDPQPVTPVIRRTTLIPRSRTKSAFTS